MVRAIGKSGAPVSAFFRMMMDNHPETVYENWTFRCDVHGEFQTIISNGNTDGVCCPACKAEAEQKRQQEAAAREFTENLVKYQGIPEDNSEAVLDKFEVRTDEGPEVRSADKDAYDSVKEMTKTFSNKYFKTYSMVRNVTLCGKTGVGKSFLGCALIRESVLQKKSCFYIRDSVMKSKSMASYKKGGPESEEFRKTMESYDLLVIDDVDPKRWADGKSTFLADLIMTRYDAVKQTLILSNRTKEDLYAGFGGAVESRIRRGLVVTMIGEDRRKKQKQQLLLENVG